MPMKRTPAFIFIKQVGSLAKKQRKGGRGGGEKKGGEKKKKGEEKVLSRLSLFSMPSSGNELLRWAYGEIRWKKKERGKGKGGDLNIHLFLIVNSELRHRAVPKGKGKKGGQTRGDSPGFPPRCFLCHQE